VAEGELQRDLGKNIASYRKARGLSQEAFADELGYHRTYVGGLERGERNLSLKAVERLAESLGVEPLDLLRKPPRRRVKRS
jgi:transcriptional regulator with XRE-family HTH domain